ncbi:MAG: DNA topoisomerase I, partial [Candidatus Bathyarchaeia archaeon]
DIILNLSPDAPRPPGRWKEIVWQPDNMWIAKWDDKLRGVEKYVWIADSSFLKQKKEIDKFNAALRLEEKIPALTRHIMEGLKSPDVKRRKVATVCYLINKLKIRVGDEKDKDEADTVGATTLRPEHVTISNGNMVRFDFLGKDSVRFIREVQLPDQVVENLKGFIQTANSSIFQGVRSEVVSDFLGEVAEGVTAKVFRTFYASQAVREYLRANPVDRAAPDYLKKHVAVMANLQAAITLNHKRKLPKKWQESLDKKKARLKDLKAKRRKAETAIAKLRLKIEEMKATKEYNLGTSLKSYIDPRIYYDWGRRVDFDWKLFYSKTLQRKFSWVEQPVDNQRQS